MNKNRKDNINIDNAGKDIIQNDSGNSKTPVISNEEKCSKCGAIMTTSRNKSAKFVIYYCSQCKDFARLIPKNSSG